MLNEKDKLANDVVKHMMENDFFSQWLDIKILEIKEGHSRIRMTVRKEMVNGFGIVHGGIPFSLADSAFAFACNNRNNLSVALDTSINFTQRFRFFPAFKHIFWQGLINFSAFRFPGHHFIGYFFYFFSRVPDY